MSRKKVAITKVGRVKRAAAAARSTRNLPNRGISSQMKAAYRQLTKPSR